MQRLFIRNLAHQSGHELRIDRIDQAEWNLGLCYLNTGKSDKAKQIFQHIANTQTNYKNKALELLDEMGSN